MHVAIWNDTKSALVVKLTGNGDDHQSFVHIAPNMMHIWTREGAYPIFLKDRLNRNLGSVAYPGEYRCTIERGHYQIK